MLNSTFCSKAPPLQDSGNRTAWQIGGT